MSAHQYGMVMDLNKCIGCHTCTMACKKQWTDGDGMDYMYWNNVETHPGIGYPRAWHTLGGGFDEQRHLRPSVLPGKADYGEAFEYDYAQRLFEGKGKPTMPHVEPTYAPNWDEDVGAFDTTNPYYFYLPRICNHCTHPACLEACPKKAIYKRQEDGIVLIDQERCAGYRYCIKACPYKKIYFNEVTQKSEKCIFCYPRLEKGLVNACAAQCPGRIRFVGLVDDPESPVHKLVMKYRVALGLFPEKGTHPNVFYVPPFNPPKTGKAGGSILADPRLPLDYLKYLFGPEVVRVIEFLEGELQNSQRGQPSEVLQLLIGRDASVRYRVVPKVTEAAAPADVRKARADQADSPKLILPGTAGAAGATKAERRSIEEERGAPHLAEAAAGSHDRPLPEAVRAAFGMALGVGSADPVSCHTGQSPAAASPCGTCGISTGCGSKPPGAGHAAPGGAGGEEPWF